MPSSAMRATALFCRSSIFSVTLFSLVLVPFWVPQMPLLLPSSLLRPFPFVCPHLLSHSLWTEQHHRCRNYQERLGELAAQE